MKTECAKKPSACACDHSKHLWCAAHWLSLHGLHRATLAAHMGVIGQPASSAYQKAARRFKRVLVKEGTW